MVGSEGGTGRPPAHGGSAKSWGEDGSRDRTGTFLWVMERSNRNIPGTGSIPTRYHMSPTAAARMALG